LLPQDCYHQTQMMLGILKLKAHLPLHLCFDLHSVKSNKYLIVPYVSFEEGDSAAMEKKLNMPLCKLLVILTMKHSEDILCNNNLILDTTHSLHSSRFWNVNE
jgi:hypothetical protein